MTFVFAPPHDTGPLDEDIVPPPAPPPGPQSAPGDALPAVHPVPGPRSVATARLAIAVTVAAWLAAVVHTLATRAIAPSSVSGRDMVAIAAALIVMTLLTFSALMYLVARYGALVRLRDHCRVPRGELDEHFSQYDRSLTVLVPAYAEEPRVVRATLWSAALQEFPSMRVVLLLDDPPDQTDPATTARLDQTHALATELRERLGPPRHRYETALRDFASTPPSDPSARQVFQLVRHFDSAVSWLQDVARAERRDDHVDGFFIDEVVLGLARELHVTAVALRRALALRRHPSRRRMIQLHLRLVRIFSADVTVFERKRFVSLSHEANKAMNLNAYLSLMGSTWREVSTASGTVLLPVDGTTASDLRVPEPDYLLTLDADSLLLREYCLRLVHELEAPGNERVAVVQTPYSSFRGAPTRVERIAGATTDLQHLQHQGKTQFNATFWVGANAVIRKSALDDIAETRIEGDLVVRTFIQDRTVIEDTESSIDLGAKGWTLLNYPERLSYSATPPDFGSLIVQRRRWANGGLIILPKLLMALRQRRRRGERVRAGEIALRLDYLGSITSSSVGLLLLIMFPGASQLLSPLVILAVLPYFFAMGSDLRRSGHRARDVLWVYGLNLVLLPVNLAGTLKSLQQAVTGRKIPFARTPKVKDRTSAPALYVLLPYVLSAILALGAWRQLHDRNWGGQAIAATSAVMACVGAVAFIGIRNTAADVWIGTKDRLGWAGPPTPEPVVAAPTEPDWEAVLYYGELHPLTIETQTPQQPH